MKIKSKKSTLEKVMGTSIILMFMCLFVIGCPSSSSSSTEPTATDSNTGRSFMATANADIFAGGTGIDTVSYADDSAGVTITLDESGNFTGTSSSGTFANGDMLTSIENLIGGSGADTLTGNSVANVLDGLAGDDTLNGLAGDDTLNGRAGDDTLNGGEGDDTLEGGAGADWISYKDLPANTIIFGFNLTLADDGAMFTSGSFNLGTGDTIMNIENIEGSNFQDRMTGNNLANTLFGRGGDDSIIGEAGDDTLDGGTGDDTIQGGAGADTLMGGTGNDTASYGSDTAGVTITLQDDGSASGASQISGGDAAGDTFSGIENLLGGSGADTLTGNSRANTLTGGGGADTLTGGAGNDTIQGGTGNDTASYASDTAGVTITLADDGSASGASQISGGDAAGDTLSGIENLQGGSGADTLTSNSGANTLNGGAGNDTLDGGTGNDTLTGGTGNDIFIASSGTDTITDFRTGSSQLWFGDFTGVAGQTDLAIGLDVANQVLQIKFDSNGDGSNDAIINFSDIATTSAGQAGATFNTHIRDRINYTSTP